MSQSRTAQQANVPTTVGPTDPVEQMLDEMFLTPRIIDQRAFESFAGSLRGLVEDAAAQSRALGNASTEVKLLGEQLREASRELGERVDRAAKVVPTIDQRLAKVETLLETPPPPPSIDPVMIDRLVRAAVERAVAEQVARVDLGPVARAAGEIEARLVLLASQAAETAARAGAAQVSLEAATDGSVVRVASLIDQAEGVLRRAEVAQRALDASVEAAEVRLAAIGDRIEAQRTHCESSMTQAGAQLGAALSEAERRSQTIATGLEASLVDFERRARETREAHDAEADRARQDAVREASDAGVALRTILTETQRQRASLSEQLRLASEAAERLLARVEGAKQAQPGASAADVEAASVRARAVGDALAQLVAHADRVGHGLSALIERAGERGR